MIEKLEQYHVAEDSRYGSPTLIDVIDKVNEIIDCLNSISIRRGIRGEQIIVIHNADKYFKMED